MLLTSAYRQGLSERERGQGLHPSRQEDQLYQVKSTCRSMNIENLNMTLLDTTIRTVMYVIRIPPGQFSVDDVYRRRWRHVQHLAEQFWRRWIRLYLPTLQERHKWSAVKRNIKVGDLVLLLDENTPRNLWPLAIVKEVNTGRDALVRSVRVKTRVTELVRPITKVVLLEGVGETL